MDVLTILRELEERARASLLGDKYDASRRILTQRHEALVHADHHLPATPDLPTLKPNKTAAEPALPPSPSTSTAKSEFSDLSLWDTSSAEQIDVSFSNAFPIYFSNCHLQRCKHSLQWGVAHTQKWARFAGEGIQ
jgi:hypothetical protein